MGGTSEPVPEREHHASGTVQARGVRLDGELHGEWTWYRTDGSVMRTGTFDRGHQVGTWRTLARDGRLVKETRFPDAEPPAG